MRIDLNALINIPAQTKTINKIVYNPQGNEGVFGDPRIIKNIAEGQKKQHKNEAVQ
jgi:hypothetical protein